MRERAISGIVVCLMVVAASGVLTAEEKTSTSSASASVKEDSSRASRASTAQEPATSAIKFSPSIEVLGPSVIELRCPWLKTAVGSKVELGSCDPPACPSGWKDVGVAKSCSAHSLWCGQGCATVGECSRYCVR